MIKIDDLGSGDPNQAAGARRRIRISSSLNDDEEDQVTLDSMIDQ